jgi:polyisoprenoid-binding protein YceI
MKTAFLITYFIISFFAFQDLVSLKSNKEDSTLSYSANHSLHDWTGVNKATDCVIVLDESGKTIQKVAVSARVADFDSQNSSRDAHALEVLEAIKFPKVQFVSTQIIDHKDGLTVIGNLNFHGISKPVKFEASKKITQNMLVVEGEFPVSMEAFKVERPSFMMIKTDDNLNISFHLSFEIKK